MNFDSGAAAELAKLQAQRYVYVTTICTVPYVAVTGRKLFPLCIVVLK